MKEFIKNIKFAWYYAKSEKNKIIGFIICNFIQLFIGVVVPIISARIIVNLTDNNIKQVVFMAFVLFLVESLRNTIFMLVRFFAQRTYRETFTKLQLDLGKSILKLKNSCIDENSSGVFIQRLTNDTSKIADVFNLINFRFTDILTNIGIFCAVLIIDYRVFIYLLLWVVIIGVIERRRVSLRNEKDKEFRKENENVSGFVGELVRGVRDIKMLSAEKSFLKELHTKLIHLNGTRYEMTKVDREYSFFAGFLRDFLDFSMICLLVYLIYVGQMTIAVALVVHNYMSHVMYIVNSYSTLLEGIKDFNLSTNRIYAIINSREFPKEKFGKRHLENVKGNFEFKDVEFSYNDKDIILKDLSFKVKNGSTVAFVGASGAGKTTIFNLLCLMYDNYKGLISIDGEDIRELDKESIRDNITVISQNPYIFNLSIRDNLRLVKDDLTEEEMIEACRAACLEEFIMALPDRYDTIVGEGGVTLSGGQRQRLAIARALVQNTKIILFDEATSALDNITQTKIAEAIENLQGNYTVLIIAHRLSTIVNSDRILFLKDGKIETEGTHDELLNNCLEYKELYDAEIEK
ncbi:MAG: ABC transporter ATP-binding protein [Bacilli bacterium]|nr:ABC transporter ATP-binding protein [Bacilli bacterium]